MIIFIIITLSHSTIALFCGGKQNVSLEPHSERIKSKLRPSTWPLLANLIRQVLQQQTKNPNGHGHDSIRFGWIYKTTITNFAVASNLVCWFGVSRRLTFRSFNNHRHFNGVKKNWQLEQLGGPNLEVNEKSVEMHHVHSRAPRVIVFSWSWSRRHVKVEDNNHHHHHHHPSN